MTRGVPLIVDPGTQFGELTVIREIEAVGTNRRLLCKCSCGAEKIAWINGLRAGKTQSCGCIFRRTMLVARTIIAEERRERAQVTSEGRLCLTCNEWKPWSKFRASAKNLHTGKSSNCTECARWNLIKRTYGISKSQWHHMFDTQDGGCALCGGVNANGHNLHVDHDHACCGYTRGCPNCVRGLLCDTCNRMIGMAENKPKLRSLFAFYLDRRPLLTT
jgi:Recombination endonuclease VII